MGFVILLVMVVYLAISLGVVSWAIKHAKKNGLSVKKWGWGAALVMYMIPFWDWIPTVAVHQYYCAKDSGFWVYKTFDQWKAENPGVMEGWRGRATGTQGEIEGYGYGYKETHKLNQRFNWIINHRRASSVLQISKREEALVDTNNGEILARFVDFSRGSQRSTGSVRFWLVSNDCNGREIFRVRMGKLIGEIEASVKVDRN